MRVSVEYKPHGEFVFHRAAFAEGDAAVKAVAYLQHKPGMDDGLPRAGRRKMDQYQDAIYRSTEEYNNSDPGVKIYFAMGKVLSEEYPGKNRQELFRLADERMYRLTRKKICDINTVDSIDIEYNEAFVRTWALVQCGVSSATGLLWFQSHSLWDQKAWIGRFFIANKSGRMEML